MSSDVLSENIMVLSAILVPVVVNVWMRDSWQWSIRFCLVGVSLLVSCCLLLLYLIVWV
jgi:hypothetical protein